MKNKTLVKAIAVILALSSACALASCNTPSGNGEVTTEETTLSTTVNESNGGTTAGDSDTTTKNEEVPEAPTLSEYTLISGGNECKATATTGSISVDGGYVKMNSAVLALNEAVVLPFNEGAEWDISFAGVLAPGGSGKGNILADKTEKEGRFYLGVNVSNQIIFVGICINGVYANYAWDVPLATLSSDHSYSVSYKDYEFWLSIDGGEAMSMSSMNIAQKNVTDVFGEQASSELLDKIRAIKGQPYVTMKFIGSSTHPCTSELSSLKITTTSPAGNKELTSHPLSDLTIYYLGSSITRGHGGNTDGTSFAEITTNITGGNFEKAAVSGTTLALTSSRTDSYLERFSQLSKDTAPDYIVIQLSSNDFKKGVPVGQISESKNISDFSQYTITGAIETLIARSKQQWGDDVTVVFYSCPIGTGWVKYAEYKEYVNVTMKELEKKWAGDMVMLDIFNSAYTNNPSFIQSDALHPQKEGYSQLFVPEWIKLLYRLENIK